jgi:phage tail-like protein
MKHEHRTALGRRAFLRRAALGTGTVALSIGAAVAETAQAAPGAAQIDSFRMIQLAREGGASLGLFSDCSEIGSESQVNEQWAQLGPGVTAVSFSPGVTTFFDVTLSRGLITGSQDLWIWRQLVLDGQIAQARQNVWVEVLTADFKPLYRWLLVNAWPAELILSGSGQEATERLTLVHERARRLKV